MTTRTSHRFFGLRDQTVTHRHEFEARFEIDPFTKHRLLNGLDDIGLTLQYADDIDTFESSRPSYKPSLG